MENNTLEIFSVEQYQMFKKDMITKTGTIEQICEEVLKNNKGYHLNYNPEDKVILFGDIDHIINEETFFKIKLKIEDYFNIDDIDYTKSIKENELSYHWSFNNYCTTVENLKNHMIKFIELNKDFLNTEIIDITIYNKNSWFRLPNQTNKDKPFIHKIVNGNMESFIVNYVPNDCEEFEILIEEKSNNKSIKNDNLNITRYENLLKCLSYYRCNNYNDWLRVKFILNNELGTEGYNIFDEWSQKSEKYDKDETYNFYNDIKIKDDGLKIGTLIKMAKEDNLELYNQLFKMNNNNKSLFDEPLTTRSLGNHFKSLYGDKFIYQNSKLYYFNSIYWESEDIKEKLININNFIADVYFNDVMDLCKKYENNELNKEKIDKSELIKKNEWHKK